MWVWEQILQLWRHGANLATTLAVFLGFMYLYTYYSIQKRQIWQDVISSKKYKKEKISKVIKNIVYIAFPITLTAIMSAINKNVDSITVVRCLKSFLSETEAKVQYGILSGKIDTLVTLPLSFNIAIATALVPGISFARAKKDDEQIKRKISFSLLITILIGLPCAIRNVYFCKSNIKFIISKCSRR